MRRIYYDEDKGMTNSKTKLNRVVNKVKFGQYFSMSYLIRYGYFDFKFNQKQYKEDYIC